MNQKSKVGQAIKIYLFLLVLIFAVAYVNHARAEITHHDHLALHIEKTCRVSCVDAGLLKFALIEAKEKQKMDPFLMAAIIHVESGFRVNAENRKNGRSIGLTQIQINWHKKRFTTTNYFDVIQNVSVGAEIYKECEKRHNGVVKKALWCYNGHQKKGMMEYVPKVIRVYKELKQKPIFI